MPRSLTGGATTAKNAQFGSEPICVLGVRWGGGNEIKYAERTTPFAAGVITELGSLSEAIQIDSSSTSASVTVTLSDTDGSLKSIVDSVDIHKNRCTVYQWFDSLAESDAFVLFSGEISSPIKWSEADRTLSFTVLSKIETREVGFSPEEGQFADVSPSLIGKVWPLAFGQVVHVPVAKSVEKLRGATQTLIGIPDYTLPYKYWHLRERYDILREGFQYYKSAIYVLLQSIPVLTAQQTALQAVLANPRITDEVAINAFFNYISSGAQGLEDLYCAAILDQDSRRQSFENINKYITVQGKKSDDLKALADDENSDALDEPALTGLISKITSAFTELQGLVSLSPTAVTAGLGGSIISLVSAAIETSREAAQSAIQAKNFKSAAEELAKAYVAILDGAKSLSEATNKELELITGTKDLVHVDVENAEYVFQNVKSILARINKLYVNMYKTQRELFKVNTVIQQHALIPRNQVIVTGGERFPQNTDVLITINDMTYSGQFSGNVFTVRAIQPRYQNIATTISSRTIDSFEIADPTIDLRGHYCLVSVPTNTRSPDYDPGNPYGFRIFQVTNQIGTRCTMQLTELNPTVARRQGVRPPLMKDLPSYLWDRLASASEHTEEEKRRILEGAIPKYDSDELDRIKKNLDKLKETSEGATDDDTIAVIHETIYKNIREYNDKVTNLKYKVEDVEKADQKISEEEYRNLIRLQNLKYRLSDTNDEDFEIIPSNRFYYVTGFEVFRIMASSPTMLPGWFQYAPGGQEISQDATVVALPNGSRIKANILPDSGLWFAEIGSSVELVNNQREKYIANILPSSIASVYAYRNTDGVRQLIPVPSRYYTKNETDNYGGLTCTSITLYQRLQDYPNEGWEDTLFVSLTSSVGPNTVDIIQWIAEHYTDLTVDATSFAAVRAAVAIYPSSFALLTKKDALTLIKEIAWQARCSVWVVGTTLYIQYLSATPPSVATILDSHIVPKTLELEYTTTEELTTKLTATWKPNYAVDSPNQIVLRHNVSKYGTMENEYDFYIYNIESLVQKSATFWLIRKANTWKLINFKTPLLNLQVQAFDGITLNLNPNHFASAPVLGVVQSLSYAINENKLQFAIWLPIRSGEMSPYDFAFPSSIAVGKIYPSNSEVIGGFAGSRGSNVPTNVGFTISTNTNLIQTLNLRPKDYGRPFLSDVFDSSPGSVLSGLQEVDYVGLKPDKYKMPDQPRSAELNAKPEYITPSAVKLETASTGPFPARISSIVNADTGVYMVRTATNVEHQVQQYGGGIELSVGDPVTVLKDFTGELVVNERATSTGLTIKQYKILEESDDYLTCKLYDVEDETTEGDEIAIAKPRLLQKTPFDGKEIEYEDKTVSYSYSGNGFRYASVQTTVLNDSSAEVDITIRQAQRIIPSYFVDDIITAFNGPTGLSTAGDEKKIVWTDLNTGGRVWAHSPQEDPEI